MNPIRRFRRPRALRGVAVALVLIAAGSCTAGSPKEVVIVTYAGFALPEKAAAVFKDRTGYEVRVRSTGDAGQALNEAILTSGRPQGDVFFGVDNAFLSRATASDAFLRHQPPAAASLPGDLRIDPTGTFTPIDTGDVCVNADSVWFSEHDIAIPATFDDLVDPRYRGLLVVEDPAKSSPGLVFLSGTRAVYGKGADDWWRRARANDVAVAPSWDDAWGTRYTVSGGDRPLVVSYASSPPAEVVYADPPIERPRSVVVTGTCVRQIELAGVLRGARHPDVARRLVEFMLSPAWQEELPLTNFVRPVVASTPLPKVFTDFAPEVRNPIVVPVPEVARDRDRWLTSWRDVMG